MCIALLHCIYIYHSILYYITAQYTVICDIGYDSPDTLCDISATNIVICLFPRGCGPFARSPAERNGTANAVFTPHPFIFVCVFTTIYIYM